MRHDRTSTDRNDGNYRIDDFSATLLDIYSNLRHAIEPSTRAPEKAPSILKSGHAARTSAVALGRIVVRPLIERSERPFDE